MGIDTTKKTKRRALGKGLGALLPSTGPASSKAQSSSNIQATSKAHTTLSPKIERNTAKGTIAPPYQNKNQSVTNTVAATNEAITSIAKTESNYFKVSVEDIHPSPEQPRRVFSPEKLNELASSIKEHGVIQPLIVRKRPLGGYFLIAGERRWRACQKAGVLDIPVVVQSVTDKEAFERAIVENVQRADLNVIEEAEAYQRLISEHRLTQENVAQRVGKDRSTVANTLRLLKLPNDVRGMVENETLSMGHARALLSLDNPSDISRLAKNAASQKLSVRNVEKLIKAFKNGVPIKPKTKVKSASVRDLEERLSKALGAPVAVQANKKNSGGRLEINYADLDDLDRLIDQFMGYK